MLDKSKGPLPASPLGHCSIPEASDVRCKRLRAEGNWIAFCNRKQSYRQQGSTPKEADIMAHRDFPPPGLVETSEGPEIREPTDQAAPVSAPPELDMSTPDIRRDAYWAYNHIGIKGVTQAQAPSQGAWNMLKHFGHDAQTIRDFLEEIAKPMLKSEPKGESYSDDGRELIVLCERKRAEFAAEAAREREEAA